MKSGFCPGCPERTRRPRPQEGVGEPVYADHYVLKDSMKEESSGEEDLMTKEGWRRTSTNKVGELVEYLPEGEEQGGGEERPSATSLNNIDTLRMSQNHPTTVNTSGTCPEARPHPSL
ncbi:unnamed protein product [Arctogadus glacialis]